MALLSHQAICALWCECPGIFHEPKWHVVFGAIDRVQAFEIAPSVAQSETGASAP
jgi:hypothetical protein